MYRYKNEELGGEYTPPHLPLLMTAEQLAGWSGLPQLYVEAFLCGDKLAGGSRRSHQVGRAFDIELAAFVDFWQSVESCPKRLVYLCVAPQSIGIASELQSQDAGALAIIDEIARGMGDGAAVEPVKLMCVPGEPHRIIDGRKRCCAAWKRGVAALPACLVPHSPAVSAWLDLRSARGRRAPHERPADYVGRIFDALPEYAEAVAGGIISYRQVRDALGLESHLPVFRVLRKRRKVDGAGGMELKNAGSGIQADFGQLRAAIKSWSRLCEKESESFGTSHYAALARIRQAATLLLDSR